MDEELKFYKRSDVVNFMGLTADATEYTRMKGFTSVPDNTNVETDETKYVDEKNKRKRTTGYATEKSYEADRIIGNKIHDMLAEVQELELTDVNRPIVTVDFNKEGKTSGTYYARKRLYSVIPDSAGDDENKYTISGTLGANGEIEEGEATSTDGWKTCTFTKKTTTETEKYTITYNANGGTGTIASVEVEKGKSVTLSDGTGLTAPTGKTFKGWAKTNSAQNPSVTSPFTPTADTTLYAIYGE